MYYVATDLHSMCYDYELLSENYIILQFKKRQSIQILNIIMAIMKISKN